MKNKILLGPKVAFVLIVLVTLACGTSPQAASTTIPEVEPSPAATSTPEAPPDVSTARISLDELPSGFEEIPTDEILVAAKASDKSEYLPEVVFAFVNTSEFQVILGMNFLLDGPMERLGFGSALKNGDNSLKEFAGAMGGKNIREAKILDGMEALGEKQKAMTMLADVEGIPMRVDGVMFQRDIVGGMILSMTMEGEVANISLQELGTLLDRHIRETLDPAE
jgi:hypothetical protein